MKSATKWKTSSGIPRAGTACACSVNMRARLFTTSLVLALGWTRIASAQSWLGPERRDVSLLRGDIWATVTAPAHISGRDVAPIGLAAAVILAAVPYDSSIHNWIVSHPHSSLVRVITPFRERQVLPLDGFGSWEYLLPLSAGLYSSGRLAHDASRRDAGLGCAAAHLSSVGLREIVYLGVSRVRPSETSDPMQITIPGRRPWADHSFLSGHIANSMACASFLAHRFHVGLGAPAMYAYASAIGAGRIADGWHWTSDTIAGGALGYAIGKFIAGRQLARAAVATKVAQPTDPLTVTWRISF